MLRLREILIGALRLEVPVPFKERSWGFKTGVILAGLHFILFVSNALYMIDHQDGRWHMFWIFCAYADFPVSLLLTQIILPLFFHGGMWYDPYMDRSMSAMMTFAVFYAVAGTTWYFFLPVLIERVTRKIAASVWTTALVITIMIIPIFAHWLQLLRFAAYEAKCFVPGLYSILPAIWIILLAWLYFARAQRKITLWLLLLAPLVFFYFVRDLYYYMAYVHH